MIASTLSRFRRTFAASFVALLITGLAYAGTPITAVNTEQGLAIKGYDPVAYFTDAKPIQGSAQFSATYQGAVYHFVSEEHRDRFIAEPAKYAPQYGGYCAYAMALNTIADIDPDEWAIIDGRLYLNNNFFSQTLWSFNKRGNISRGDRNWPSVPKLGEPKS
jgi:YHS domain-containing protein